MKNIKQGIFRLFGVGCLGLFALAGQAQEEGAEPWVNVCPDDGEATSCRMVQELLLRQEVDGEEKILGRVLRLTVLYADVGEERKPYLGIQLPLGVDLRPGLVMRVDEGEELPLAYLRCSEDGCDTSLPLEPDLLWKMKKGITLFIGFRPWGDEQTAVLEASLSGFTKKFDELE